MAKLTDVEMKMNLDASEAGKALKKFGGTLEEVAGEGVQPLNFAIGELEDRLYEMAAAGDTSSAKFKAMSAEVGKMKKVIIDTDLTIDGMAQTTAQNMGGALTGVASGFELAQGAMGAFGVSGEAVEESLLRVQSAMAMAQGLQGLKESGAAFKALKSSIMATTVVQKALNFVMNNNPIGWLVGAIVAMGVAIAALWNPIKDILGWMGLISTAESEADHQREVFANMEKARKEEARRQLELERAAKERAFNEEQGALDRQIALYQAQGKDVTELVRLKTEASIANVKNNLKEIESLLKLQLAMKEVGEKASTNMAKAIGKGNEDAASDTAKAVSEMKEEILNFENDIKIASIESGKSKANSAKEERERLLNFNRKIQDMELSLMEDGVEKELLILNTKFDREIEDTLSSETLKQTEKNKIIAALEKQRAAESLAITENAEATKTAKEIELNQQKLDRDKAQRELLRETTATDRENELAELQASYAAKFELAEGNFELQIALKKELNKKEKELRDKNNKEDLAAKKAVEEAKLNAASTAFGSIGDLANAFANDSEKSQKKAFKINKAVQMAQAVIATYQGANAIFASAAANPATVAFPAQPFIMAGAAIASGLANVATIAKTKFQGGSSGGGGGGGSAPSLPSASSSPTFNVIGDSGTNQLAESLGGPQKAYVVSGDVTTAQSLDRNKIENASI